MRAARRGRASTRSACGTRRSTCSRSRSSPPAACDEWDEDALYELVPARRALRRPRPRRFRRRRRHALRGDRHQPRPRRARSSIATRVNRRLRGRRGARLAALTSGGAIPDNANYDVILEPDGTQIGTVDEDFAIEIDGRRRLPARELAPGASAASSRARCASRTRTARRPPSRSGWARGRRARASCRPRWRRCARRSSTRTRDGEDAAPAARSTACALDRRGAELLRDYVLAGAAALGGVPTQTRVFAERFFDDAGGMQLVIHAPFGGRDQPRLGDGAAQALLPVVRLRAPGRGDRRRRSCCRSGRSTASRWRRSSRCCARTDVDGAADAGRPAGADVRDALALERDALAGAAAQPRRQAGPAGPPADARAGSDRRGLPGADRLPGQPRRRRRSRSPTIRWCARRSATAWSRRWTPRACARVLEAMARGRDPDAPRASCPSRRCSRTRSSTPTPTPSSTTRRWRSGARARSACGAACRPRSSSGSAGSTRRRSMRCVAEVAGRGARSPTSCTTLLLDAGALPEAMGRARGFGDLFEALVAGAPRRAPRGRSGPVGRGRTALAGGAGLARAPLRPRRRRAAGAPRARLVRSARARSSRWCAVTWPFTGPTTAARIAAPLGVRPPTSRRRWRRSSSAGACLRGRFLSDAASERGDDGPVVRAPPARADQPPHARRPPARDRAGHRRRLPALPVRLAERAPGHASSTGSPGWRASIAQLQGFEAAAGAWERAILPARLVGYDSAWLDALCLSGGVAWGRLAARPAGGTPSRAAPIALCRRADLPWLLVPETESFDEAALSAPARDVLGHLTGRGRSFLDEIVAGTRRLRDRGRGRARRAGLGGPRHGRRVLRSPRAHLGDADARRRPRALALPLEPPHRRTGRRGALGGLAARDDGDATRATRRRARGARAPVHQEIWRRVPRSAGARGARAGLARSGPRSTAAWR